MQVLPLKGQRGFRMLLGFQSPGHLKEPPVVRRFQKPFRRLSHAGEKLLSLRPRQRRGKRRVELAQLRSPFLGL